MSTPKRTTRCESCNRPINPDTTHLSFFQVVDGLVCTYTCQPCGHVHERLMNDACTERLIRAAYGFPVLQDDTR